MSSLQRNIITGHNMKLQDTIKRILLEELEDSHFIKKHIEKTNPHSGAIDAFMGIPPLKNYKWFTNPIVIYPDDEKINKKMLYPASQKDVKKYMKQYINGSEFPPIVLLDKGSEYDIFDGAHRLTAAINLGVPIKAYVGRKLI